MLTMNEDELDLATQERMLAVLADLKKHLDAAQKSRFVRSGLTFHRAFRSKRRRFEPDPLSQLLETLSSAHRGISGHSLKRVNVVNVIESLRRELESFRQRRRYRFLRKLFAVANLPPVRLEEALASLVRLVPPAGTSRGLNLGPAVHPRLLDLGSDAWASVSSLRQRGKLGEVTIVIPVYRGREETLACINSVLSARNQTPACLLVIDDCSPDEQLASDLGRLWEAGYLELVRHSKNQGFVSAVNGGMLAAAGDVVLLNADTVVSDRWLDHLHYAAGSRPDLASVSPLSNNATILSYPYLNEINPLPPDSSLDTICRFLEERPAGALVEIPTTVGFCMYIPRPALEDVGVFDEATFGLGYGEESDWAMRARQKGYRHYVTTRSFVYHQGGVSFSEQAIQLRADAAEIVRRRHPDYWPLVAEHIDANPLAKTRRFLDSRRLIQKVGQKPTVLHVLHGLGGGTEAHVRTLSRILEAQGVLSLFAQPDQVGRLRILSNFMSHVPNLVFAGFGDNEELWALLRDIDVRYIHLHHVLGFAPEVLEFAGVIDVPLVATLHDYAYICPQIVLLNHQNLFCGVPSPTVCHQCISAKPPWNGDVKNVAKLRQDMYQFLSRAERVIAPSHTAAMLYQRAWPDLSITVIPHPEQRLPTKASTACQGDTRTVAIIGSISGHKGAHIVEACVRDADERELPLKFVVIGDIDARLASPRLAVTGGFNPAILPKLVQESGATIGLLPSISPETYSYVLSEYYRFGLHPVVLDIGAQAERVRAARYGTIVPVNAGARTINETLLSAKSDGLVGDPQCDSSDEMYVRACYKRLFGTN